MKCVYAWRVYRINSVHTVTLALPGFLSRGTPAAHRAVVAVSEFVRPRTAGIRRPRRGSRRESTATLVASRCRRRSLTLTRRPTLAQYASSRLLGGVQLTLQAFF